MHRHGVLKIEEIIDGERRYGKELAFKKKVIQVISTIREGKVRVITCYRRVRERKK